jgi:hypothetical protein
MQTFFLAASLILLLLMLLCRVWISRPRSAPGHR